MRLIDYLIAGTLIAGFVASGMFGHLLFFPNCTTRIIETEQAMLASDKAMASLDPNDQQAMCRVYRQRVAALTDAMPISIACGPPQSRSPSLWPQKHIELSFYQSLVAERCGSI